MSEWAKNAAAFMSLAMTERRLSWQYRRIANETADRGFSAEAARMAGEARRLWRSAKGHVRIARSNYELSQRTN